MLQKLSSLLIVFLPAFFLISLPSRLQALPMLEEGDGASAEQNAVRNSSSLNSPVGDAHGNMSNIGKTTSGADLSRGVGEVGFSETAETPSSDPSSEAISQAQGNLEAVPLAAVPGPAQRELLASAAASSAGVPDLTSRSIVQVPPLRVRAEQTLRDLEHDNQIAAQAVERLLRFTRASKTMVCLRACN